MKLIIAGSTGFVAAELIRQALPNPAITSILALARRETAVPAGVDGDTTKLKSVICEDFENYPASVKEHLSGADACIWLIAVTPSQLKTMPFQEARKICFDYTVKGLELITKLPHGSKPFRFVYISGALSERDQTKTPRVLPEYCLMRGETESYVLDCAKESQGTLEACVAKPGLILGPGRETIERGVVGLPKVNVSEISATLLEQVVNGIEKDTLLNEDLIRIGQKALA